MLMGMLGDDQVLMLCNSVDESYEVYTSTAWQCFKQVLLMAN